ncbi:MAG: hypothetical protein WAU78_10100 [Roseiarcus sp.]
MTDRLGSKGNPVIGYPPPEGCRWQIVGKWPDGHIEDSGPQTDQEVLQLYEHPADLEIVKKALGTVRKSGPVS